MLQRTIYAGIIGGSALVGVFATTLPWARWESIAVSPNNVRTVSAAVPGTDARVGALAMLAAVVLAGLVIWFWQDRGAKRTRVASVLMLASAAFLLIAAVLAFSDLEGRVLADGGQPESLSQPTSTAREGLYLTTAAGAIAVLASFGATVFYRPARDQRALGFERAAFAWFLGVPALSFLFLTGWAELGLRVPQAALPLFELTYGRRFSAALDPLGEPFRHLVAPLVLIGLLVGIPAGLARTRLKAAPVLASGLVILGCVAFAAFIGLRTIGCRPYTSCYWNVPSYAGELAEPSPESYDQFEDFAVDAQSLGFAAALVAASVWAGVGIVELGRVVQGRLRRVAPAPKAAP